MGLVLDHSYFIFEIPSSTKSEVSHASCALNSLSYTLIISTRRDRKINVALLLAERCNCIAMSGYYRDMLSVCRLSVPRVYCDKTTEVNSCCVMLTMFYFVKF